MKAYIFQSKTTTTVIIAKTIIDANRILRTNVATSKLDYLFAGSIHCLEDASISVSSFNDSIEY